MPLKSKFNVFGDGKIFQHVELFWVNMEFTIRVEVRNRVPRGLLAGKCDECVGVRRSLGKEKRRFRRLERNATESIGARLNGGA
jgi:hypothetical protein